MKKLLIFLTLFIFGVSNISADLLNSSTNRDVASNKVEINTGALKGYISAELFFDYNGNTQCFTSSSLINNLDVFYDNKEDTIKVFIKRSEINKLIEDKYTNMYDKIKINLDIHNYSDTSYMLKQTSDNVESDYETILLNHNKSYYELESSVVSILPNNTTSSESFKYGKKLIYDAGSNYQNIIDSINNQTSTIKYNETNGQGIFFSGGSNIIITVIEDAQTDFKNISTLIDESIMSKNIVKQQNNFVSRVENNKILYTFTTFDKDGNPLEESSNKNILDSSPFETDYSNMFKDFNLESLMFLTILYDNESDNVVKISYDVSKKFETSYNLKLYAYDDEAEKLVLYDQNIQVSKDGLATFEVSKYSNYILALNNVSTNVGYLSSEIDMTGYTNPPTNFYIIISFVIGIVFVLTLLFKHFTRKKYKVIVKNDDPLKKVVIK